LTEKALPFFVTLLQDFSGTFNH